MSAEIPKKKYAKCTQASSCRELLNRIKSLTFPVNDVDVIDQLKDNLKDALEALECHAPNDDGIVTEPVKVRRTIRSSNILQNLSV